MIRIIFTLLNLIEVLAIKPLTPNVKKLLMFSNIPSVSLAGNGKAFTSSPELLQLTSGNHDDFATYLADVIKGMAEKELEVDYINPVNDLQLEWAVGQAGTVFWNNEMARIIKTLNGELKQRNITPSKNISEAGQINICMRKVMVRKEQRRCRKKFNNYCRVIVSNSILDA